MLRLSYGISLAGLGVVALLGSKGWAASVVADGSDTEKGASWRTASVAKTDPAGKNVLGQDGYDVVGTNSRVSLPSYVSSITPFAVFPGIGGYQLIDDPNTTPGATPTTIQSGTTTPGGGVGAQEVDYTFTTNGSAPAQFQVAVLIDNLDVAPYNPASVTIFQSSGTGATAAPTAAESIATTGSVFNDRSGDLVYFLISGAQSGDVFTVGGTGGTNGDVTDSFIAFDVPEPASLGLLGLGGLALLARRRRA